MDNGLSLNNQITRSGSYQYIKLIDFVNDFILSQPDDSYVKNENPQRVLLFARKGLQELHFETLREIRSIELDVEANGQLFVPSDFVGLVRLSYVDSEGYARVMVQDETLSLGNKYLQDNDLKILLSDTLQPLLADRTESSKPKEYKIKCGCDSSDLLSSGEYVLDKKGGFIAFTKIPKSQTFLLEYFSDGLVDENEEVHKFAEEALTAYVFWNLIRNNRSVPKYDKDQARSEYYNQKRIADERLNPIQWSKIRAIYNDAN